MNKDIHCKCMHIIKPFACSCISQWRSLNVPSLGKHRTTNCRQLAVTVRPVAFGLFTRPTREALCRNLANKPDHLRVEYPCSPPASAFLRIIKGFGMDNRTKGSRCKNCPPLHPSKLHSSANALPLLLAYTLFRTQGQQALDTVISNKHKDSHRHNGKHLTLHSSQLK